MRSQRSANTARSSTSHTAAPRPENFLKQTRDGSKFFGKVPTVKDPRTGKMQYAWTSKSTSRDETLAKIAQLLARQEQSGQKLLTKGTWQPQTTGEWLEFWLDNIILLKCSRTTYDLYRNAAEGHLASLADVPLPALTFTVIESWRNGLLAQGVGRPTINYCLTRLKTALEAASAPGRFEMTGIRDNPAHHVEKLKVPKRRRKTSDPRDVGKLVAVLGETHMAALPQVVTDAGLRRGEISGLHWGDVDLERGTLTLRWHVVSSGKGAARTTRLEPGSKADEDEATVSISSRSVKALRLARERLAFARFKRAGKASTVHYMDATGARLAAYVIPSNPIAPEALVFPNSEGDVYEPGALAGWFSTVCKRAGVVKTLHGMRHDCASIMFAAGGLVNDVSRHLRHANPAVTLAVYAHPITGQAQRSAELMDGVWDSLDAAQEQEEAAV